MGIHRNRQRGTWQVECHFVLQSQMQRIRKDFPKKSDAEAHLREIEAMVRQAKAAEILGLLPQQGAPAAGPARRKLTFEDWWHDCREYSRMRNRPTTLARTDVLVRYDILPALGEIPLEEVSANDIEKLQTAMCARGLAPSTVRQAMAVVGSCLHRAVRLGKIDWDPMQRVEKVRLKTAEQAWTYLDFAECDRYLAAAREDDPIWYALLLMAVRTGLRRGELLGLRWKDVALDRAQLVVRNTRTKVGGTHIVVEGPPKSGKDRAMGLTPMLVEALRALPSRFKGGYVFTDAEGQPIEPDKQKAPHTRALKKAGITRHVRFHDTRHTWASHMAMRGVPLATIQQLGGWASYVMVQRYAHLSRESVIAAVNVLEQGAVD